MPFQRRERLIEDIIRYGYVELPVIPSMLNLLFPDVNAHQWADANYIKLTFEHKQGKSFQRWVRFQQDVKRIVAESL